MRIAFAGVLFATILGCSTTRPAADTVLLNGKVFTVADDSGQVMALEAESGKQLWRADVNERLTAGVGSDGRWPGRVACGN